MAHRRLSHSPSSGNISGKIQHHTITNNETEETASSSTTTTRLFRSGSLEVTKNETNSPITTAIITGTNVVRGSRKAFTEYEITVTEDISSWIIKRRYRQFHALNEYLKSQYGSLVPKHFPPKKLSNNLSPHSIDKRHQLLQSWLQSVLRDKTMASDAKLRLFLTQDRKEVDFRPVMTRDRSGSEVKIQSSVENLGYLHQLKKGRWKRRWFLLRHGILYKYSTPKDKHPFRSYELRGAKATILALNQLHSDQKISKARKKSNVSTPTIIATAVVGKKKDDKDKDKEKEKEKEKDKETTETTNSSSQTMDRVKTQHSAPTISSSSSERKVMFSLDVNKNENELDVSSHDESDDSSAEGGPPSSSSSLHPNRAGLSSTHSSSTSLKVSSTLFPFAVDSPHNGRLIFGCESEAERLDWVNAINKESERVDLSPRRISPGQSPRDRSASFTEGVEIPRLFGVSLNQIKEVDPDGAPLFISTLLDYIEATALHKEDLFTVVPDPQLKKHLEQGGEIDLTVIDNPHAVAGLVLEWLRELASPIIPSDFYDCFVSAFKISDTTARFKVVQTIVSQLPDINRSLLYRLFKFLNVASAKKSLQKERLVKLFGRLIFRPKPEHEKGGLISSLTSQLIDRFDILQIPKTGPQPKTTKRRSEPKREKQSHSQTQDQEPLNSKSKAQEQLDRSINRLQQTLSRLQNQQTWFEAQPTQTHPTNTEQRLSESDSHPVLERTDSFYINLITRLKNIDYDSVQGAIARAGSDESVSEHEKKNATTSSNLDKIDESSSEEFQRKFKEDKELFDSVFSDVIQDSNDKKTETKNNNNQMSTAKSTQQSEVHLISEEDENKKLFDQLFAGGGDSDSESFDESPPTSQTKTVTTLKITNTTHQ